MIDLNHIDDLARRLSGLVPPGLRESREELQENFKAVLDLKVNQSEISAAQLKQIIGIIDRAALDISQLD